MPTHSHRSEVTLQWPILALSSALYLSAFAAPYDGGIGLAIFLWGLFYCWLVHWTFSWWANVAYWVAWGYFCAGHWSRAARWGLVATALAAAWAFIEPRALQAPAYLLWVGSMAVLGAVALVLASWAEIEQTPARELPLSGKEHVSRVEPDARVRTSVKVTR